MLKLIATLAVLTFMVLGFQNCGYFSTSGVYAGSSCGGISNTADALPAFSSGYHQFFIGNGCNSCHTGGGLKGDSPFGDPDASIALDAFSSLGPETIDVKLRGSHQGYEYSNLEAELNSARSAYEASSGSGFCSDGVNTTGAKFVRFFDTTTNTDAEGNTYNPVLPDAQLQVTQQIEFSLEEAPYTPALEGVSVRISITISFTDTVDVPRRPTFYEVNNIEIRSISQQVSVQGVSILLNNNNGNVTTFESIDEIVLPGNFWTPISGAATGSFGDGNFSNSDSWQVRFNQISFL